MGAQGAQTPKTPVSGPGRVIGLLLGALVLKLLNLAFFCVGAASGGILGYYLYTLALHAMDSGTLIFGHDAVFWGSVLAPGLLCGLIGVKLKEGALMLLCAVLGSWAFTTGLQFLLLARLAPGANVILPQPCVFH
jgi:hypothetical protein